MAKIYLSLRPEQVQLHTGIGQVVNAQYTYLPKLGFQMVDKPEEADIIACHIGKQNLERVDVLHLHGMYYGDVQHLQYDTWHMHVNRDIVSASREALRITVPSRWVSYPFQRDMRISPVVVPHGVDLDQWKRGRNKGYVLYNKNRESDVCTSVPALELAKRGAIVKSTYAPNGAEIPETMQVLGVKSFADMREIIQCADVYLATTLETFGIGTVEALACGVPVLGFDWGGTRDLIKHKVNGYLVRPLDYNGLAEGLNYIRAHYLDMSAAAMETAKKYDWPVVIGRYGDVYQEVYDQKTKHTAAAKARVADKTADVSVVITNYNYSRWVCDAVDSALNQIIKPGEVVVVDDGSTDNSVARLEAKYANNPLVRIIKQKNQGVAVARNTGIANAKFSFITLLDADDMIDPRFVGVLAAELEKDESLGIAYSSLAFMNEDGVVSPPPGDWPPEFSWEVQSRPTVPPSNTIPSCCMFRKTMWERAGSQKQKYAPGEDAEFWTRGLSVGFMAKRVTTDKLFLYRFHSNSASRTKKYKLVNDQLPWMNDRLFPMGAPIDKNKTPIVRSYAQVMVSIIVPVGAGHEKYLTELIESVLGQTLREWELIVIDDTRDGFDKLEESGVLKPYPFIKVLKTGGETGAGNARNAGIVESHGAFVVFLDCDDYLMPDALERMVATYVNNPGKYIYTDWYRLTVDGQAIKSESKMYNQLDWNMQHPVTVLMETEQARKLMFNPDMPTWEDWDFFVRAAIKGYCGVRLAEPMLVYRTESGMRRKLSQNADGSNNAVAEKLLEELNRKYRRYYTGDIDMANCCGGGEAASNILQAKRLGMPVEEAQKETQGMETNYVRMEYKGTSVGAKTYTVNGRSYRGGNNILEKYADVYKDDVQQLKNTGFWEILAMARVDTSKNDAIAQMVTSVPQPAPVMTEKERQEFAQKRLEDAKRELEKMNQAEADNLDESYVIPVEKEEEKIFGFSNVTVEPQQEDDPFDEPEAVEEVKVPKPAKRQTYKSRKG
jgi:glycosyltransferase involved in cell wall biosynthesis